MIFHRHNIRNTREKYRDCGESVCTLKIHFTECIALKSNLLKKHQRTFQSLTYCRRPGWTNARFMFMPLKLTSFARSPEWNVIVFIFCMQVFVLMYASCLDLFSRTNKVLMEGFFSNDSQGFVSRLLHPNRPESYKYMHRLISIGLYVIWKVWQILTELFRMNRNKRSETYTF